MSLEWCRAAQCSRGDGTTGRRPCARRTLLIAWNTGYQCPVAARALAVPRPVASRAPTTRTISRRLIASVIGRRSRRISQRSVKPARAGRGPGGRSGRRAPALGAAREAQRCARLDTGLEFADANGDRRGARLDHHLVRGQGEDQRASRGRRSGTTAAATRAAVAGRARARRRRHARPRSRAPPPARCRPASPCAAPRPGCRASRRGRSQTRAAGSRRPRGAGRAGGRRASARPSESDDRCRVSGSYRR